MQKSNYEHVELCGNDLQLSVSGGGHTPCTRFRLRLAEESCKLLESYCQKEGMCVLMGNPCREYMRRACCLKSGFFIQIGPGHVGLVEEVEVDEVDRRRVE